MRMLLERRVQNMAIGNVISILNYFSLSTRCYFPVVSTRVVLGREALS